MKCLACQTFDLQTKALLVPVKVLQQDLLGLSVVVINGADSARFLLPVKETIACAETNRILDKIIGKNLKAPGQVRRLGARSRSLDFFCTRFFLNKANFFYYKLLT